jgi:YbbR domain-containing protein
MPTRERLIKFLTRNTALRFIAVALAIGLWLWVNTSEHLAQTSLEVPVAYRGLPHDYMIVNERPDFVKIEVSGPRNLLSILDPGRLELRLDLTGVSPGQASFRITPEMFNVPRLTNVTRISPSQIVLDIDRRVRRELPVHLDITGKVTPGYAIAAVELKPETVTVTGPSRDLARIERIDSEPFDVAGVTDQAEHDVDLVIPPGPIEISATRVDARIKMQEIMGDREFRTVAVKVRDSDYKYRLYTRAVAVTVHGPVRKLSTLNLEGLIYVDAHGATPGVHELPVQADLPDGLQVVRYTPDKVRLRILTSREGARS